MIKSMTGFGRHKELIDGRDILFEIKSVNGRYADLNIKTGRVYGIFEDKIKKMILNCITRGKIDAYLSVDLTDGEKIELSLNKEFLDAYVGALEQIKNNYGIQDKITLSLLASKSEAFITRKSEDDTEQLWNGIESVINSALADFTSMRTAEGERLKDDLLGHLALVETLTDKIAESAVGIAVAANEKMKARVRELLDGANVDESRLLTECAIFADKADINEELVRLKSHISQFRAFLKSDIPIGRKLDFLVQEINREVNTIGSKSADTELAKCVIEMKSEIEKLREQIQNIE